MMEEDGDARNRISPESERKRAKVDHNWITRKKSATDKEIATKLHPIANSVETFEDSPSLCEFLGKLGFLDLRIVDVKKQPKDKIMKAFNEGNLLGSEAS